MAELVFRGRISPTGYLVLYFACFLLTLVAVVAALAELRSIAAKSLKERQDLINSTLGQIRNEVAPFKRSRSGRQKPQAQDGNGPYERN